MELISLGWDRQMGNIPSGFSPPSLANLELWTKFNSGITVTGSGVSQWDDVSGNGNHLKQDTDTNRPSKEVDGSILFDGVDNFLASDAFTLPQPVSIYLLSKEVTLTINDIVVCGANSGVYVQQIGSPTGLGIRAGSTISAINTDYSANTYSVFCFVFNDTGSLIQVDDGTVVTGGSGTTALGGIVLGARSTPSLYSNIQVKESIVYSAAHDAETRSQVINYLATVGGLSI